MKTSHALGGRVAVVTGATSGIGRAIALALAAAGARLHLIGRDAARLAGTAEAVRAAGVDATGHEIDLTVDAEIDRVRDAVCGNGGGVDVLVHCAGTIALGRVAEARIEEFDRQYRTNLRAPFLLTQRLLPSIVARRGHIVFVNSSAGLRARAGVGQYAATKHGLRALADSLRDEVSACGVRVLSVFPGRTATPMQAALHADAGEPYDPSRDLDPADLATLIVDTLAVRSAEIKEIDVRPWMG